MATLTYLAHRCIVTAYLQPLSAEFLVPTENNISIGKSFAINEFFENQKTIAK
jgi:hypothetical protein